MTELNIIAKRQQMVLRQARDKDLARVDELTILCYRPIYESHVNLMGEEIYQAVRPDPELTWEERKLRQVHRIFESNPEWVWVLEGDKGIIGFCTFELAPAKSLGIIENNGVHPEYAGRGLGKWMYRQVVRYFREQGMRFAFVDTGLDDVHIPARRAYEAVGFDRKVQLVEYWQDLSKHNPGSEEQSDSH